MKYKVGDKAVHPAHGVGEITAIEDRQIAGYDKQFYILKIADSGMIVMIPTDSAERSGLRDIISKRDAEQVLAVMKKKEYAVTSQPWNRRFREYTEMMKSGKLVEVAKVLRDLSLLRQEKELSFGEKRLLEQARALIVKELALAQRQKEDRVGAALDQIFC